MKRMISLSLFIFLFVFGFSGCGVVGDEDLKLSSVYAICTVFSLLMLTLFCAFSKKRISWFFCVFISILIVNFGYFALSTAQTVTQALVSNGISYFGSVFLPMSMLMIVLDVTNVPYSKRFPVILALLGLVMFVIASSAGYSTLYYRSVSLEMVNGVSILNKVYGPLHILYLFYLVLYFAAMIAIIVRSFLRKTADSIIYSVMVAIAVFVNLGVWFLEQFTQMEFEFLSVSYIISELFLLGLILVMREHKKLKEMVKVKQLLSNIEPPTSIGGNHLVTDVDKEAIELFVFGYQRLTKTEKNVFNGYVNRLTTKEVMSSLNITENTLKFHNKNIYGKLGVSSRKQLLETYEQVKAVKGQFEE